jgi:hypothetical protein
MEAILEDLDDHEGYALWRLVDGSVIPAWADGVGEFAAYVAGCEYGWQSQLEHPPTDQGQEAAYAQWEREHALAELAHQTERRRAELAQVLRALGGIAEFLDNPTNLPRIVRAIDRARELTEAVQRDLERHGEGQEADHER